jgi:hypothetical protein
MANMTLLNDYSRLSVTNYEYGRNRPRWTFLYDSYVGGMDYRMGGYLTQYALEQGGDYNQRLLNTPLNNHCASIIAVYISFLFRNDIIRDFGLWEGRQDLADFLSNSDFEGRNLSAFMKEASAWASVFGHTWIVMSKPNVGAATLADEQQLGIRPYLNLVSPLVVNDWTWERTVSGEYELVYFKYIEEVLDKMTILKEITPTEIRTWVLDDQRKEAHIKSIEPNTLGRVPVVLLYNRKSVVKGQGISDINDIADMQRMIYNLTSEIEQSIRLDGHPTLVVRSTDQLGSGAGALIITQDGADPAAKPYYLEHGGSNVDNIRNTIKDLEASIDQMANVGGVRATASRSQSGVALETEFQLLNARLSEKADSLELAEEQLWLLFAAFQGLDWQGSIKYPDSFSMRDIEREYRELNLAKTAATSPEAMSVVDYRVRELLDDPNLPLEPITHLVSQGYTAQGPVKTGPVDPLPADNTTNPALRPRRYYSTTNTGLE